jgi:acetyltransferase-like isoleucine patch superfamily enzyme
MVKLAQGLLTKLRAGLARHRGQPPGDVAEKLARSAAALVTAKLALRGCDAVGPRARAFGRPRIDNRGQIRIGSDFAVNCAFATVELATAPGGTLAVGDQVTINFGTQITATREVRLGNRVSIGPYCVISDTDVPLAIDGGPEDRGQPIVVEDGAWLAGRVTLLPGAHVGARAVVSAGSVVRGYVPSGTVACGNPARPLRTTAARPSSGKGATALRGAIVSDFVTDELAARLREEDPPLLDARAVDEDARLDAEEVAIVWTSAESALPSLAELIAGTPMPTVRVVGEADSRARAIAVLCATSRIVLVASWTLPPELRTGPVARALAAANVRLAERLGELLPAARVLDASRWFARPDAYSPVMRYAANVPFAPEVFAEAARDIKNAMRGALGEARTALILEAPAAPRDAPAREARKELDRALEALRRRGVTVHVVGAGEAPATTERFGVAASRCVLIALDPVARTRARAASPELLVPELPSDPLLLPTTVRSLRVFGEA